MLELYIIFAYEDALLKKNIRGWEGVGGDRWTNGLRDMDCTVRGAYFALGSMASKLIRSRGITRHGHLCQDWCVRVLRQERNPSSSTLDWGLEIYVFRVIYVLILSCRCNYLAEKCTLPITTGKRALSPSTVSRLLQTRGSWILLIFHNLHS